MICSRCTVRLLILCGLAAVNCLAQTAQTTSKTPLAWQASEAALSRPVQEGSKSFKIIPGDPRSAVFTVVTSWIPGEEKKGNFRYRISASSIAPSTNTQDTVSSSADYEANVAYLRKVAACSLSLEIYDDGGFLLRSAHVSFLQNVNGAGQLLGLDSNNSFQLDLASYRSFLRTPIESSWEMSWNCD